MTGSTTVASKVASKVTALDQARLLLAQAKALKESSAAPAAPPAPADPRPEQLATVTSFDPDAHLGDAVEAPEQVVRLAAVEGVTRVPSVARVQQALDTAGVDRELPTLPAVSELLGGASLRGGSAYSVRGSAALVMALMAGPSAEGAWCGVVGVPSFGAEAARGLGVDLERLVLVPDPGHDWLNVVAALVDALTVVVVRPPGEVTPGEASRLAARLRTRGAMLVAVGSWPGSEARFEVESSTWTGLGDGEGLLTARQATITVTGRRAATNHRHHLWLPAPDGTIHPTEPATSSWHEEWPAQIGAAV
ncbi:hypothetical protein AB0E69_18280 [Kribbella sp. NPDC026611]|uniref:hypothetical protein n=1 Tax=Kribbella sp. NPDC026611 TaxID=3154911 RepID=UPI003408CE7E